MAHTLISLILPPESTYFNLEVNHLHTIDFATFAFLFLVFSFDETLLLLCLQFTTGAILEHMTKLLQIPGSKVLFGGEPLENHSIPPIYGAIKPTAIYVPLEEIVKDNNYDLVTKEIFGPFQVNSKT